MEFPCESLNITWVAESFDIAPTATEKICDMYKFGSKENLNKENVDINCTI